MNRETRLRKNGDILLVVTDNQGTRVFDINGAAIRTFGADRHDEVVDNYVANGWAIDS